MSTKSHVDLCMFIQILEVDEDRIPPDLIPALLTRDQNTIKQKIDDLITSRQKGVRDLFIDDETNLHESIHLVQAVIYPFMRWYSILLFKQIMDVFRAIKDISAVLRQSDVDTISIPSFMLLDLDYYIWDLSKRFLFWTYKHELGIALTEEATKGEGKPLIRLNTTDLLENAASLIQYKISTRRDFPSWIEFDRWSKRNPAYTRIIDFVRWFIGNDDLAIRIFCPLIQVAFETSMPTRAFTILLGAFKYNFMKGNLDAIVNQREPVRWIELFDSYMDKIRFDESDYGNLTTSKFFRLDRDATSNLRIGGRIGHPIIGYLAKLWGEFEKRDLGFRYAFTAPNGYARKIDEIREIFNAPIALLKFKVSGQNVILMTGDLNSTGVANVSGDNVSEEAIKSALVEYLAIFGVVRRFGNALMDPEFRLCHHIDCPHYESNLCNTWIFVPAKYQDCAFERRITSSFNNATKAKGFELDVQIRSIEDILAQRRPQ